ncbi:MAG: insulinase family protein [Acidobacteriota bacterium]|nr:insulinase family protein [Acidobacteriota bacterium]
MTDSYQLFIRKFFIFALLFISFIGTGFAQEGKIGNIAEQAALVTEFDVNGLKVIVKRRASAPTVSGGLFIRGGARNINEKNAGIESLMLATAVEAGRKIPRQAVRRELSRTGSNISSAAANDYSVISLASTRPNFDRVWDIFTEVALNPAFAAEDVERNKTLILTGLRESEISPEGALQGLQERMIYSGHPYANEVRGSAATIGNLTAADLRAYHQGVMQTSKLLLVFVGDLDANELKTRITASFGKLPRGDYKDQIYPVLNFSKATLDVTPRGLPTNYIQGSFSAPSLNDKDYYAMRVAMAILQSLVFQEVRVKRQLSYAPGADMNDFASNTAHISVTANDANQAVSVMLDQIKLLRTQTLNDAVIAEVAGFFLTKYYLAQETNAAQVGELARYELIGGGWRNSFEFLNRVREVKPSDIEAAANKYMKNIRFAVVGNQLAVNRTIFLQN